MVTDNAGRRLRAPVTKKSGPRHEVLPLPRPAQFGRSGADGLSSVYQCGMPNWVVVPSRSVRLKLRYDTLMSVNLLFTS